MKCKEILKKPLDLTLFHEIARKEGFVVLHSSQTGDQGQWSIVGSSQKKLKKWLDINKILNKDPKKSSKFPLVKGCVGYLAYPNGHLKSQLPEKLFYYYNSLLLYNHKNQKGYASYEEKSDLIRWQSTLKKIPKENSLKKYRTVGALKKSVTKGEYLQKIKAIKKLLEAGEVYEINYAIRFTKKFHGNAYALFLALNKNNPAPFSAYLNAGKFQIISSSPERLLSIKKGIIKTQPIKGTVSKNGYKNDLLNSEKERAELDMITDLERNDVGKVCEYGSVKVNTERGIMELRNLWHTYSEITGKIRKNTEIEAIMTSMFPGGSITGCPKIRAMEYIEKLEGKPRDIFSGAIGYLSGRSKGPELKADFNIAIRTILIRGETLEFWTGGGITVDSDPEKEYAECLLKAQKIIEVL